jgi:hypothetical protein
VPGGAGQTNTSIPVTSEALKLVERLTRISADRIRYEFTVDDPIMFTRPWTVQMFFQKTNGKIFEYACHEGNYGLANVLSGARAEEKAAGETKRKTP